MQESNLIENIQRDNTLSGKGYGGEQHYQSKWGDYRTLNIKSGAIELVDVEPQQSLNVRQNYYFFWLQGSSHPFIFIKVNHSTELLQSCLRRGLRF